MAYGAYLTPYRYRAGGYGISIPADFSNATLRNILMRASAQVNIYTNAPRFPGQFDYRGGTVTNEQHEWPFVPPLLATSNARRVYLNSRPIRDVTSFRVYLAKQYYVDLAAATQLFINSAAGYVEIVALAPTIVGYWPNGYPLGLWNPVAQVSYTYGWRYDITDDILEADSPNTFTASYGSWLPGGTVSVSIDGTPVSASDYTVSTDNGTVTFTTAPSPGTEVTASYTTTMLDAIPSATGIIATYLIAESRIAARGMIGLSSIKVAEVSLTAMQTNRRVVTRNGVTIPADAASLLDSFVTGTAA